MILNSARRHNARHWRVTPFFGLTCIWQLSSSWRAFDSFLIMTCIRQLPHHDVHLTAFLITSYTPPKDPFRTKDLSTALWLLTQAIWVSLLQHTPKASDTTILATHNTMPLSRQKAYCCLCLDKFCLDKELIVAFVSTKSLLPLSRQRAHCCLCLHKRLVAFVSTKSLLLSLSPQKACCLCLHKKLIVVFVSTKSLLPMSRQRAHCCLCLHKRLVAFVSTKSLLLSLPPQNTCWHYHPRC